MTATSIPALLEPIQELVLHQESVVRLAGPDAYDTQPLDAMTRLLAAVKAVEALHCETKRDFITAIDCIREECDCENECPTEELPVCRHCWNQLEQIDPYFGEEHHVSEVIWPCPTVSAVEAALRGEA